MERLDSPSAARDWCARERASGHTLGLVPTMGALHAGHVSLVERAVAENDRACVSVFVNPLQFDDPEDLANYPRDPARDARLLAEAGCAMVFTGELGQFFPEAPDRASIPLRDPGPCALGLEGEFRAGHFAGVATIVQRLFELVRPGRAYFGAKDFQQCLVVRDLARELGYPEIAICETRREASGLAMSSRNERLSPQERSEARVLHAALLAARAAWSAGEREASRLRQAMLGELEGTSVQLEYAEVRDPERWTAEPPVGPLERARALVAAAVGPVRLIDNLRLDP